MEFLIPPEIRSQIGLSGFISYDSPYGKMNLRRLFISLENERYLSKILMDLLTNRDFVKVVLSRNNIQNNPDLIVKLFRNRSDSIAQCVDTMSHVLPAPEYLTATNPAEQLNYANREYLKDTARDLIMNPNSIIAHFNNINQDTMEVEKLSYQGYTASSYSNGVWRPEALFTDTPSNANTPYWKPVEINFNPNSSTKTPGHKYASTVYNSDLGRTSKKFPRPRHFPRHIDRSDYGLRESGFGDRRVQSNRGYDMSDLYEESHY